jgi:hypothetical protein
MISPASHFAFRTIGVLGASTLVTLIACSNSSSNPDGGGGTCAMPGGAVSGPQDTRCVGMPIQMVNPASCNPPGGGTGDDSGSTGEGGATEGGATEGGATEGGTAESGAGDDSGGGGDDGGAADADIGNCGMPTFGATMYNSHGEDDDCKYDVTWTSTPICEGQPVYFTVTVKYRTDNTPVTGANARPDVVLDCSHLSMSPIMPADPSPEVMPGVYKVGPIVFDQRGEWVFRFHFFETCQDQPDSPHGHAAFWVQVP